MFIVLVTFFQISPALMIREAINRCNTLDNQESSGDKITMNVPTICKLLTEKMVDTRSGRPYFTIFYSVLASSLLPLRRIQGTLDEFLEFKLA